MRERENYMYHDDDDYHVNLMRGKFKWNVNYADSPVRYLAQIALTVRMDNFCWIFIHAANG